jgi:hypothetical protein
MDGNTEVKARLLALYDELFAHDGYATLRVEIRILRRGQKEVIVDCGKQYRFVVDCLRKPRGRNDDARGDAPASLSEHA